MDKETKASFARIESQLERLSLELCKNSSDISGLKVQAQMGKGALKTILFLGALVAIVLSVIKIGENTW